MPSETGPQLSTANSSITFVHEGPMIRRGVRFSPKVRLVCFPHAGASASYFSEWSAILPEEIEVIGIQLAGRGDRIGEPVTTEVESLVSTIAETLTPYLDRPIAFFGHSAGALCAFEVARALHQSGSDVAQLFLSGQPAPDLPRRDPLHLLGDAEFDQRICELGGMPPELLAHDSARALLLKPVRSDFVLWGNRRFEPGTPIASAITAFGGDADPRATVEELRSWGSHTSGQFRMQLFEGGHFFISSQRTAMLSSIIHELAVIGSP